MVCGVVEWTAISVAMAVVLFSGGYFGKVVWDHARRIDETNDRVELVETRVTKIEVAQVNCQTQLADRLLKGDRSFEAINTQVQTLANTAAGLMEITKQLQTMVDKIDQRIWDGMERRVG